ncbi:MAG: tannase/feruloyl esterase family alpha/beta hydrolase [Acidimicrobiia bacterium]|nr:tannase/feruloyl esterase family alpha/beta hydrolase [Acidimicrobiia bacterium]
MKRYVVAGLLVTTAPMLAQTARPAGGGTACGSLAALTIPDVTVNAATAVAAGEFKMPGPQLPGSNPPPLPAFCRVEATARPTSDSEIKFEVWIPPVDAWNGKFQGVGNGGYQGSISYGAMANALRRGYATASTDTGHTGDDVRFGQGHPEKVIDYGWRAVHLMTEHAKLILRNAQGRFADKSYFVGCSAGGHQAMSLAQRFPNDYDGIIAGAPAHNRIRQTFGFAHAWLATHSADGSPILTAATLALVTTAAVAACDANDTLKDGLVEDPRKCAFDATSLVCKPGADESTCLTPAQAAAVNKVHDGAKNPRTGEQIFTGWPKGSEAFGESAGQSWRQYITDQKEPSRVGVFKYWLFNDPNWDVRTLDFDRDFAYANERLPYMHAVDQNLAPFKRGGGKLIAYAGWMDPVVPPQDTAAYYEGVAKAMGGYAQTRDFFRLFMAPGMGHCSGGPGPNSIDALTALENWVEKGIAPDKLIASHSAGGKVDRTRPLCPYPAVARYTGKGSIDDAANFACVVPQAPSATRTSQ